VTLQKSHLKKVLRKWASQKNSFSPEILNYIDEFSARIISDLTGFIPSVSISLTLIEETTWQGAEGGICYKMILWTENVTVIDHLVV